MSLSLRALSARPRRGIILALAVAILLAGFAQAAHFHKDELAGHESQADIHCLLCQFAAGTAGPPTPAAVLAAPERALGILAVLAPLPVMQAAAAPYDARGPPAR
jgi:hypothetical protein